MQRSFSYLTELKVTVKYTKLRVNAFEDGGSSQQEETNLTESSETCQAKDKQRLCFPPVKEQATL